MRGAGNKGEQPENIMQTNNLTPDTSLTKTRLAAPAVRAGAPASKTNIATLDGGRGRCGGGSGGGGGILIALRSRVSLVERGRQRGSGPLVEG